MRLTYIYASRMHLPVKFIIKLAIIIRDYFVHCFCKNKNLQQFSNSVKKVHCEER